MSKKLVFILVVVLLVLQTVAVSASSASDAREEWRDAKKVSKEMQELHREAKLTFAGDKSPENEQEVIDTGKDVLNAALDEAEFWLLWKDLEAQDNPDVPDDIKDAISDDVAANLDKIDELRGDVDGVTNRFELGVVFLKMIGKYFELLADVSRNSGMMWVHIGNVRADKIEDFSDRLREEAEDMDDNEDILDKLDMADEELEIARRNIDDAEDTYAQVKIPGTPLIKFGEGNQYLRAAKLNLVSAHRYLNQAYRAVVAGGE